MHEHSKAAGNNISHCWLGMSAQHVGLLQLFWEQLRLTLKLKVIWSQDLSDFEVNQYISIGLPGVPGALFIRTASHMA